MNEKEFLKEHPGLKGKGLYSNDTNCLDKLDNVFIRKDIRETQLDKDKLREIIDKLHIVGIMRTKGRLMSVEDLKEELGLKQINLNKIVGGK